MLVDGILASVGTANMDYRSFSLNFEVNALIYDEKTSETLTNTFIRNLQNSTLITLETWHKWKKINVLRSSIARIFSPLL